MNKHLTTLMLITALVTLSSRAIASTDVVALWPWDTVIEYSTLVRSGGGSSPPFKFHADAGSTVYVYLSGSKVLNDENKLVWNSPYGFIEGPGLSSGQYFPPLGAKDGQNDGVFGISQSGTFTYVVLCDKNLGQAVKVRLVISPSTPAMYDWVDHLMIRNDQLRLTVNYPGH